MDFYDDLAPLYHLVFPDWSQSIQRQGEQLDQVFQSEWPGHRTVLDVSCGIGNQALALAGRGYTVVGSDLSAKEIERARREADLRGLAIDFTVCDMRTAYEAHGTGYDLVIACDNAVPHLLTDDDLLHAFGQFFACLRPGGGCAITVRDYDKEERGTNLVKHYGARIEDGKRYVLFQVWDFQGDHYDLSFFIVEDDLLTGQVKTHTMRSRYYAVPVARLCALMRDAGFENVKRLDDAFYQPVLVGTKPAIGKGRMQPKPDIQLHRAVHMPLAWSSLTCTPPFDALQELDGSWGWLVGEPFEPILFSVLGDVFPERASRGVWWLNTGTGELIEVASSVSKFQTLLGTDQVNGWFLPDLVAQLHGAGKVPGPGECFTFVTLPVFSQGRYEVSNLNPVPVREHFGVTGRIIRKIEGYPDGAQVRVKFE